MFVNGKIVLITVLQQELAKLAQFNLQDWEQILSYSHAEAKNSKTFGKPQEIWSESTYSSG